MYNLSGILESNKETNLLKIKTEESVYGSKKYTFVNYNKKMLTSFHYDSYGLFRSVVMDENAERVLCFSPPKAMDAGAFIKMYPSATHDDIICEETVEGVMINAFYDEDVQTWQLCTKQKFATKVYGGVITTVGGSKVKINMDDLFADVFKEVTGHSLSKDSILNKHYCYSFVLQHPSLQSVIPFTPFRIENAKCNVAFSLKSTHEMGRLNEKRCKKASITFIAAYSIDNSTSKVHRMIAVPFPDGILVPKRHNIISNNNEQVAVDEQLASMTYTAFIDKFASMNAPYTVPGFTIYNRRTGERCKVRNPSYETIRHLKGVEPKLLFQYLSIRRSNETTVEKYLQEYPDNKKKFQEFRDHLYLFTQTLYDNYVKHFIKKEIQMMEIPKEYKSHLHNLHNIYLNELVYKKSFINFRIVTNYVNGLHPAQLVHSLIPAWPRL